MDPAEPGPEVSFEAMRFGCKVSASEGAVKAVRADFPPEY